MREKVNKQRKCFRHRRSNTKSVNEHLSCCIKIYIYWNIHSHRGMKSHLFMEILINTLLTEKASEQRRYLIRCGRRVNALIVALSQRFLNTPLRPRSVSHTSAKTWLQRQGAKIGLRFTGNSLFSPNVWETQQAGLYLHLLISSSRDNLKPSRERKKNQVIESRWAFDWKSTSVLRCFGCHQIIFE